MSPDGKSGDGNKYGLIAFEQSGNHHVGVNYCVVSHGLPSARFYFGVDLFQRHFACSALCRNLLRTAHCRNAIVTVGDAHTERNAFFVYKARHTHAQVGLQINAQLTANSRSLQSCLPCRIYF